MSEEPNVESCKVSHLFHVSTRYSLSSTAVHNFTTWTANHLVTWWYGSLRPNLSESARHLSLSNAAYSYIYTKRDWSTYAIAPSNYEVYHVSGKATWQPRCAGPKYRVESSWTRQNRMSACHSMPICDSTTVLFLENARLSTKCQGMHRKPKWL